MVDMLTVQWFPGFDDFLLITSRHARVFLDLVRPLIPALLVYLQAFIDLVFGRIMRQHGGQSYTILYSHCTALSLIYHRG